MHKLLRKVALAVVWVLSECAFAAEGPSFLSRPLLAGRASLTADGFVEAAS